jgi:hypothetical protein
MQSAALFTPPGKQSASSDGPGKTREETTKKVACLIKKTQSATVQTPDTERDPIAKSNRGAYIILGAGMAAMTVVAVAAYLLHDVIDKSLS